LRPVTGCSTRLEVGHETPARSTRRWLAAQWERGGSLRRRLDFGSEPGTKATLLSFVVRDLSKEL
jgi:hypothetical protein